MKQKIDFQKIIELVRSHCHAQLKSRFGQIKVENKADGSLVTEADLAMQQAIEQALLQLYPETLLLGEEMTPQQQAQVLTSEAGVWILDPIDGTSNFARGLPYYCVSLALMLEGRIIWGLVYDPERDEVFHARLGAGAYLNNQRLHAPAHDLPLNKTLAGVDFKRLTPELATRIVQNPPYASQRSLGAIALDWCWVAAGRMQVYIHGKQNLWDYAAGWLILQEAMGESEDFNGQTVFNGSLEKRPAIAACSSALLAEWRAALF
jgi:myo-inositol-1(or 4)-monophosphatase